MKKIGRKPAVIDWDEVEQLLVAGYKGTEVAAHFGIHPNTFYHHCEEEKKMSFSEYLQQKRAKGDGLIKLAQFDLAVRERDRTMLIWLGKNRLGQSDRSEVAHKGKMPIEIVNFGDQPIEPWKEKGSKSYSSISS